MVAKDADEKVQRITKLLEKGGTMLAQHHECGAPMFRYQGKVICPVCDLQEKPEIKMRPAEKGAEALIPKKPLPLQGLNEIVMNKIYDIVLSLEGETDLTRVKDKMDCIEQGIRIMKSLRENDK